MGKKGVSLDFRANLDSVSSWYWYILESLIVAKTMRKLLSISANFSGSFHY